MAVEAWNHAQYTSFFSVLLQYIKEISEFCNNIIVNIENIVGCAMT